jgi:hypothetical protein
MFVVLVMTPGIVRQKNEFLEGCRGKHMRPLCSDVFGPDANSEDCPENRSERDEPKNQNPDRVKPDEHSNCRS